MQELFGKAAKLIRFYNPDNAQLIATEEGARNVELYPIFCGHNVDFIIGGQIPQIPDFRLKLKDIKCPIMVLAGRYDRALYPQLQHEFVDYGNNIDFHILEKSGSFSHIEETDLVIEKLQEFWNKNK